MASAACNNHNPDLAFPMDGGLISTRSSKEKHSEFLGRKRAKTTQTCPPVHVCFALLLQISYFYPLAFLLTSVFGFPGHFRIFSGCQLLRSIHSKCRLFHD